MQFDALRNNLQSSVEKVWDNLLAYVPNLISSLLILAVGYFISKVIQKIVVRLLNTLRFDKMAEKVGIYAGLKKVGISRSASELIGITVFWLFLLVFVIAAAESLRLNNLSKTIDLFVLYLPNVLGAALIFVFGLMLAHFLRGIIYNASERVNVEYARILANVTHGILIVLVTVLAVGQLQIEVQLLHRIIEIVLLAGGAALAISLGFGTRELSKNIVAGVYAREQYSQGSMVKVGEKAGRLREIGTISAIIETKDGKAVHIPNSMLTETVVLEEPTS